MNATVIALANHKGGTGKTTTVVNLGSALSNAGKKVLLVDLDPQGNLSYSLGVSGEPGHVGEFMLGTRPFEEVACEAGALHVLPADGRLYRDLAKLEAARNNSLLLKHALAQVATQYDFILLDCAPALSLYTTNAFNAAHGVIVPMVFEILSIQGLDQILEEIRRIKESSNPGLQVIGVLGVIVNESRKLSEEVLEYVRDHYQVNVFNNRVRNNVKAAEAPSFGLSVIDYAPASGSAKDYVNIARELLAMLSDHKNLINQESINQ